MVVEMKGLGRGYGFEVTGRRSALDDNSIIRPIKQRLLGLLTLLKTRNMISDEEVRNALGLEEAQRGENDESEDELGTEEEVEEEVEEESASNYDNGVSIRKSINRLIDDVGDAMDENPDSWLKDHDEDNLNADLKLLSAGLKRLISEYLAFRAMDE